jgi:hypothetical protein
MTFPITGVLILIMGVCFFFFSPRLLYAAMIISIPFSATAVANVGSGDGEKGVAAWLFLGALWVFRETISSGLSPWKTPGWVSTRRARYGLLAFLGAVVASLSVPLFLNGTVWVPESFLLSNETIPVRFGMYNVTQTAYLAFGVLLAIFAAAENCQSSRLVYTLRLYVGSCAFAAAWGLFELWCDVSGHPYPAYIFNTNAGESALGYMEVLNLAAGTLARISSVALEPSVLAQELLLAFVVLLVCLGLRRPLLGKKWDYAVLALIVTTLLASTSSTAYSGILAAMVVAAVALSRAGRPWKPYVLLAGIAVGAGALVTVTVPLAGQIIDMMILNKFETGSGMERLYSNQLAAQDFMRYPLLGVGWHNVNCTDLVFLILANTGLVGLAAFGSFLLPVLRGLWVSAREGKLAGVVLLSAVVLMVLLAEAAGLTYAAGYVWLVFGLGAGAVIAARGETAIETGKLVGASHQQRSRTQPAEGTC